MPYNQATIDELSVAVRATLGATDPHTDRSATYNNIVTALLADNNLVADNTQNDIENFLKHLKRTFVPNADDLIDTIDFDALMTTYRQHFNVITTFLFVLENIFEEKFPLPETLLEIIDQQHRPCSFLWGRYMAWDGQGNFSEVMGNTDKNVAYFDDNDRATHTVKITNNQLCKSTDEVIDTSQAEGTKPGYYAFALIRGADGSPQLILHPHQKGLYQHSSHNAGNSVLCTGMIRVVQGKITHINNHSGHYRPTREDFRKLFEFLPREIFDTDAKVFAESCRFPNKRDRWLAEESMFWKKSGRLLRDVISTHTFHVRETDSQADVLKRFDGQPVRPPQAPEDDTYENPTCFFPCCADMRGCF